MKSEFRGTLQDVTRFKGYDTDDTQRMSYRQSGFGFDYYFKIWSSREVMARAIRMQQKRAPHSADWQPIIKLKDIEGY